MNKTVKLTVAIIAFALLIVVAAIMYNEFADEYRLNTLVTEPPFTTADTLSTNNSGTAQTTQAETEADTSAPDFTVIDWEGNSVSLSDFVGRPIVVNFWASRCSPCKMEMPDFNEAFAKYGEDIVFMMVNLTDGSRETVETAKSFIEDQGYTFPVYFDTESSASAVYNTYSIPVTYFIDKDGNLIARANGMLDAETLEKGIGMIITDDG